MIEPITKRVKNGDRVIEMTLMRSEPSGEKGGRPRLVLTDEGRQFVEMMAGYGATKEEIAESIGASLETLQNERNGEVFREAIKKGANEFKTSLRVAQMKAAKAGSVPMLIFLGKNYLGQTDRMAQDVSVRRTREDITVDEALEWLESNDSL